MANLVKSALILIRREVFRDSFLLEVKRWFSDDGDNTLRLDYELGEESVVWDLGGYHGDFSARIRDKFDSRIFLFEPMPEFFSYCVERFQGSKKITCLPFGLSGESGWFDISDGNDASSLLRSVGTDVRRIEVRSIADMFDQLKVDRVDLLKINIEGGEFDVLNALLDNNLMNRINFLQVQFHNFVPRAQERREKIRVRLTETHKEMWNYPFVWESWRLR